MSYRTKIFLAVLGIVIPPVMALSAFSVYSLKEMGAQLLSRHRQTFASRYDERLRAWHSGFALQARLELEKVELALQMQVAEVERRPEVDTGSVPAQTDAARAHTAESLRRIAASFERSMVCQFVTLDGDTLWVQGPGTLNDASCLAQNPDAGAVEREQALPGLWTATDPGGTGARIVFARSVRRPGGGVAGSTGIVLSADRLFNLLTIPDTVPSGSRVVLVALPINLRTLPELWPIILQANLDGIKEKQSARFVPGGELSVNQDTFEPLRLALDTGVGGILRLPDEDRDHMWIYEPVKEGMLSILIVPFEETILPLSQSESFIQDRIQVQGIVLTCLVAVLALALFFVSLVFSRRITGQAHRLTDGIVRLAQGDFEARVQLAARDELGEVGAAFNTLASRMKDYTACQGALSLAREIQQNLLPHSSPQLDGIEVAGGTSYCDETGGDYFDYLTDCHSERDQLVVVVGDVAGHGISAALIMASVRALLHQQVQKYSSFATILSSINRQLYRDSRDSGMFMTLFCAWIDAGGRTIRWVRAGHDPALTYDSRTQSFGELNGKGVALGVLENYAFTEYTVTLIPGQILLFMTDGLWESRNLYGHVFGKERLRELVRQNASASTREIRETILSAVEEFCHPLRPEDDITLVVAKLSA
jgi:sigma-B regulation protein RsbU (phosphoserine phosphatase)